MKKILLVLIFLFATSTVWGQGIVPRTPRTWVDNYAKIVSARGLVNPSANAFSSLKSLVENNAGRIIVLDSAQTYSCSVSTASDGIFIPANTHIVLNGARVRFYGNAAGVYGFVVAGDNVSITGGEIWWTSTVNYSQTDGSQGNPILIGSYSTGVGFSGTYVSDIKIKHDQTDNASIYFFGRTRNFYIGNISADTLGSGALVGGHWGGASSPTTATMHPSNGVIENITVNRQNIVNSEVVFLSGCYNIDVRNVRGLYVHKLADVTCGDYGYFYQERATGSGVSFDSLTIRGQGITFTNCLGISIGGDVMYKVSGIPDYTQTPAAVDTVIYDMPVTFNQCRAQMNLIPGGVGFSFNNCRGVTMNDCSVTGAQTSGVATGANVAMLSIIGGRFTDNVDYGVAIAATGASPLFPKIENVYFRNNGASDVLIGAKGGLIQGCVFGDSGITSTSPYNIYGDTASEYVFVSNNRFMAAATGAMRVEQAHDIVETNNHFIGSGVISSNRYDGTTGNAGTVLKFSGVAGEAFNFPPGARIGPTSSYFDIRAESNAIRLQRNGGGAATVDFYGNDTDIDFTVFEDTVRSNKPLAVSTGSGAGLLAIGAASGGGSFSFQGPSSSAANMIVSLSNALSDGYCFTLDSISPTTWNVVWAACGGGGGSVGPWNSNANTANPALLYFGAGDTAFTVADGTQKTTVRSGNNDTLYLVGKTTTRVGATGITVIDTAWSYATGTVYNKTKMDSIYAQTGRFASGGGGGSTDSVGSMAGPAKMFGDATADNDWLGLGATAPRITFEDDGSDTLILQGGVVVYAGTGADTTDNDVRLKEGQLEVLQNSSSSALFSVNNSANSPVTISPPGGLTSHPLTISRSAGKSPTSISLAANGEGGDAFVKYSDSLLRYILAGINATDSGAFLESVGSPTGDTMSDAVTQRVRRFVEATRTHQDYGKQFFWHDTAGNTSMRLRDNGTIEVLTVDQVGDSGQAPKTPWGIRFGPNNDSIRYFGNGLVISADTVRSTLGTDISSGEMATGAVDLASGTVTGILGAANGGTANGFTAFTGPTTSTKTFTLPNATATILTSNAAVTVPQGGTGATTLTSNGVVIGNGTSAVTITSEGATGTVLKGNTGADPSFGAVSLTADVSGITPVANGGTGVASPTDNTILIGNGSSAMTAVAAGTTGNVLKAVTSSDPVWGALDSTNITDKSVGSGDLSDSLVYSNTFKDSSAVKFIYGRAVSLITPGEDSTDQFGEFYIHSATDTMAGLWCVRDTNLNASGRSQDSIVLVFDIPDFVFTADSAFFSILYRINTDSVKFRSLRGPSGSTSSSHVQKNDIQLLALPTTARAGTASTNYTVKSDYAFAPDGTNWLSSGTKRRGGKYYVIIYTDLAASGVVAIKEAKWRIRPY